jgi:ABC-type dipeptide/oligopeptide/nickel transport system ATPase component
MTERGAPLLDVRDLHTHFETDEGVGRAVDGVSFTVETGRTLGILGESGCGKSVTALSILRLVSPPGRVVSGAILYRGKDLLRLTERRRAVRGAEIMVFQEPMTSLNPVFTIGNQIGEAVRLCQRLDRSGVRTRVIEALRGSRFRSLSDVPRAIPMSSRRHAPAGDDRHGARMRAEPADRR